MKVRIKKIRSADYISDIAMPQYMTPGAAGMDISSANAEELVIPPMTTKIVPTGIAFEIPQGYEIQIRPRSGLAFKHGISVLNSPGTIDSDYRGEVKVIMYNFGGEAFVVTPKMRIAQGVLCQANQAVLVEVDELTDSERGEGGFGSTGT